MRIAAVVQRYGAEIVGGAERLCRGVAEGLAARGHDVEVMTSCARSYRSWANAFPEGVESVNGVVVRRFRVEQERDMTAFNAASARLFGSRENIADQEAWVKAQGPYAPRLVDHLHGVSTDFERLIFFTYLYHPTVHGVHVAPERSVLVPTAHDEAPIHLEIYEAVFSLPAGLIFNTEAEAAFVHRRFPRTTAKERVVGVGIDALEALSATPDSLADDDSPTALYAGRIEPGKGVAEMIDYVARFRDDSGVPLRLWIMGEVAMDLPAHEWLDVSGFVDDDEKVRRLRRAGVVIAPSPLESFGIVVLEAMAAHTPVLVNSKAEAAVEHCRKANAGLYYRGYPEFRSALELLLGDQQLRKAMAQRGASYVRENYSWPEIINRYEEFLQEL